MEPAAESRATPSATQPPRWMRRGTILMLLVLAILALGLVSYFLLPGAWARAIGSVTRGRPAWPHGVGLGLLSSAAAIATAVGALRIRRRTVKAGAPPDMDRTASAAPTAPTEATESTEATGSTEATESAESGGRAARPRRSGRQIAILVLIAATAVLAAPTVLTLLIATGLTDPLARADVDLRITAPGFTVGTLIGVVVAALGAGAGRLLWVNRERSRRGSGRP